MATELKICNLPGAPFGCFLDMNGIDTGEAISQIDSSQELLLSRFYDCDGLLVIRGLGGIEDQPELLVRLSRLFGEEVENYRQTMTNPQFFHESVDEILVLSNLPPCSFEPPPRPVPAQTPQGTLPLQYPHRTGWHTDQSYRRPPPDISLLLGLICPPPDQGQTLYANGISALQALDLETRNEINERNGIHAMALLGRIRSEVESGMRPKSLLPHQQPQKQPLVRLHPVSGKETLYLCDPRQMDYIDGPVEGLEPGLGGKGDRLLIKLVKHCTQPEFIYVHEWKQGDLVIHDNRNMIHTPTWYDSLKYSRLMWRTSVMGNPGQEYKGEKKSWVPPKGQHSMEGLEDLKF